MNVGRYLRGEDLHVGTSRITKPKELKMNERIKELKQQARDFYLLQEDLDCSTKELHELVEQKFAELIIRDCINCTKEWYEARIADSARDYSRGYVHGCDEAIAEMKKRFGVEE
jgi:predicted metal-dependent phosphoesterase TrpH